MLTEYFKELDSLFRFYGSQITAHSNYLVGFLFASAVFSYRLIDRIEKHSVARYDIILTILFSVFGIWLYGRLIYYSALSLIVQDCMCLTWHGKTYSQNYLDFFEKEQEKKSGFANIISDILSNRVRYRFCIQVDEDFEDIAKIGRIELWKACLIAFSKPKTLLFVGVFGVVCFVFCFLLEL